MDRTPIREITILPGRGRHGEPEGFDAITIRPGDTVSIVGPTGSGKSAFINDIEVFAQNDTATGRTVLVNGAYPPEEFVRDPAHKPVALITQNTRCFADLTVEEFLAMHVRSRRIEEDGIVDRTINLANEFTGEEIRSCARMTALSGGQTRSLLVADAVLVAAAPVLLLDEVENAGIFKERVIEVLRAGGKAVIFVTHDPLISLLSARRIVMRDGAVEKVIEPDGRENDALREARRLDGILHCMRERIRAGDLVTGRVGV
ncbi:MULTISPECIES: ATP-binding cassette domain-containing protein [unclassified Methanoculleus]|jgi:ABC-type lipoprotein export system ATPase subunit|uniref:ATP-binding cassette domain-containing protein n=1 Tax=Methanoculleus palmolei TaxID=72612 RepID=A0ABD8AAF3_9EURY|nr:ATP-binding cassette domain-containing protein [Methanoculleus sp. UBA377]MDD2472483.1 ATP-binding cassette domain-containing protein [Methanoculleus sp.]WOX56514.1 ATP-binding cassette domain-containing protein [Methanoculleus palmolei]